MSAIYGNLVTEAFNDQTSERPGHMHYGLVPFLTQRMIRYSFFTINDSYMHAQIRAVFSEKLPLTKGITPNFLMLHYDHGKALK